MLSAEGIPLVDRDVLVFDCLTLLTVRSEHTGASQQGCAWILALTMHWKSLHFNPQFSHYSYLGTLQTISALALQPLPASY